MKYWITGSDKNRLREVTVDFSRGQTKSDYYAHNIREIGQETDQEGKMTTAWGWINHLRHKNWWTPTLEKSFLMESDKYF